MGFGQLQHGARCEDGPGAVGAALGNKARFEQMREFFGDTGDGDRAGVWEGVPQERPEFRAETKRQVIKLMKKRKAEEMI
jgi:chlorophyllide a reductase subunit Y